MLKDYIEQQQFACKMLINSIKQNRISHAYLFETNGYSSKLDFAKAFAKLLFCENLDENYHNCEECSICNRINNNNFTELKIIEPDGLWIRKEQLEELQEEFSKKAIESTKKIYIISEVEKLNVSAANSILKFLEEPEDNIIAILLTDNVYQILDTIKSRCQIITLNKNEKELETSVDSVKKRIARELASSNEELERFLTDEEFYRQIEESVSFIKYFEENKEKALTKINSLWQSIFGEKEKVSVSFEIMVLFYKDILNFKLGKSLEYFEYEKKTISNLASLNTKNKLIDKIKLLVESKKFLSYNINQGVLVDKLILKMKELDYE